MTRATHAASARAGASTGVRAPAEFVADLSVAELVRAGRGQAVDLGLVEGPDRTMHLADCAEVRDRSSNAQRIPLEAVDCFPMCGWCLCRLNTPSLGAIVRLADDISIVARMSPPSVAWVVAVHGLDVQRRGIECDFHPAMADFGASQHRLNRRALRLLWASLEPGAPGGEILRRSAMRIAALEAAAAVIGGHCALAGDWAPHVRRVVEAAQLDPALSAQALLDLAGWEATRLVARPACQPEWGHVPAPPTDPAHRLFLDLRLEPGSLEALTAELVVHDLVAAAEAIDHRALANAPKARVEVEAGPLLKSDVRQMVWRRGRIHWLRGLVDVGLLGEPVGENDPSRPLVVDVPAVVAAALRLPATVGGGSPVRGAAHTVL